MNENTRATQLVAGGVPLPNAFLDACLRYLPGHQIRILVWLLRHGYLEGRETPAGVAHEIGRALDRDSPAVRENLRGLVAAGVVLARPDRREHRFAVDLGWRGPASGRVTAQALPEVAPGTAPSGVEDTV